MKTLPEELEKRDRRVIVVLPAYNASATLEATLNEVPLQFVDEIILVDDASHDDTTAKASALGLKVIRHPENRGYGGNQKTCYKNAIESGADIIVMLHPDNQYNPQIIPNLLLPLLLDQADVVLASRFICDPLKGGPVAGGMPLLKYFVNRILTTFQNWLMGTFFSEFHTGYRAFAAEALKGVDLELLSDNFDFDNQIIAVLAYQRRRFAQVAVETRYFKEASSIRLLPGIRYASSCMNVALHYFFDRMGIRKWEWLHRAARPATPANPAT